MVRPVADDARGIVAPEAGLVRFRLDRQAPSAEVGRFVDWYWIATWDLRGQAPYDQQVFAHPVANVVFEGGVGMVHGVTTRIGSRRLEGVGRVLGVMFRPAGFRPFLGQRMTTITDRVLPATEVFGPAVVDLARAVASAADQAEMVDAADRFLSGLAPAGRQPSEEVTALVERAAADRSIVRVDRLAEETGLGMRQLQRRFAEHVGVSPKAVVRRYRLYEAAEQARGRDVDWAQLAAELGYSDQAHLTRDFSAALGVPPDRYARICRAHREGPVAVRK